MAITSFAFISCEKEKEQEGIETPTGFKIEQVENTLVLSWNSVKNAVEYVINKNGSYWQSTSATTITDKNPVNGINSYELIATNGDVESKSAKASYDFQPTENPEDPEDPVDPEDPQETADYYIKHPWGSGTDDAWEWKPMTKSGDTYTCTGAWGGVGANINTTASDNDATWFAAADIDGASSLSLGTTVKFVYKPSTSELYIEGNGGQQDKADYYIKHPWGSGNDEDWSWQPMSKSGSNYTYKGKWGGVGANINSKASDTGATWFAATSISNSSNVWLGQDVTFTYNPTKSSLSVSAETTPSETVPTAPTGLKVVDENDYRIEIEWNAVSNATYYQVYRATSASGTYSKQGGYTQACSYMDVAVTTGSTYYYKVTAINGEGESPKSAAVSGTAKTTGGGGGTTLSAPTGVTATPGSSYITVSWNSVSGASKYKVYRATSASGSYTSIATEFGTSHQDMNASSGTTYYYKVTAVASDGSESAKSSAASATMGGGGGGTTLSAPTNVNAAYIQGTHAVQVTWTEPALADSYEIYRSTSASSNGSKIGTTTSSSGAVYVDNLSSSVDQVTYYYRVKAKSSYLGKTSGYSDAASVFIDKNPIAPCMATSITASGSSSVTISWQIDEGSSCGKPTQQSLFVYDWSQNNKWVEIDVTPASYSKRNSKTLYSSDVQRYTNNTNQLIFFIKLCNANGCDSKHAGYIYNTSTGQLTFDQWYY